MNILLLDFLLTLSQYRSVFLTNKFIITVACEVCLCVIELNGSDSFRNIREYVQSYRQSVRCACVSYNLFAVDVELRALHLHILMYPYMLCYIESLIVLYIDKSMFFSRRTQHSICFHSSNTNSHCDYQLKALVYLCICVRNDLTAKISSSFVRSFVRSLHMVMFLCPINM